MILSRLQLIIAGVVIAILLVLAAVQTVRLHGFLWVDGALDNLRECERDRNELRAVLDEADRKARELQAQVDGQIKQLPIIIERAVPKGLESRPLPQNCETPDVGEWEKVLNQ